MAARRGSRFLGGGLAGLGAICFAGLLTIGFVVWQMAVPAADQQQMAALFRRLFHAPGFIIPFEVLPLGFAVGMTMLSVGLRKARIASRWSAICIGAGAIGLSLVGRRPSLRVRGSRAASCSRWVAAARPRGAWHARETANEPRASTSTSRSAPT